jgi:glycosyltransferase involved in cell wall biosynthesis
MTPTISLVVPVHNEEAIIVDQIQKIVEACRRMELVFEVVLVENGSRDRTPALCRDLAARFREVRVLTLPDGDYGVALRYGILSAAHDVVTVFNVEFWSVEFIDIALSALKTRSLVIGSKSAPGASDDRGLLRRAVTSSYNRMLRWIWGFDGTDTHGMKAFWRAPLVPMVEACVTTGWVFDTELVLRAQRAGLSRIELPTDVSEVRPPSIGALARRVPFVLTNLWKLSRHVQPWARPRRPAATPHRAA